MNLPGIPINETQCIGDSLEIFNAAFAAIKSHAELVDRQIASLSAAIYRSNEVAQSPGEAFQTGNANATQTTIIPGRYFSSLKDSVLNGIATQLGDPSAGKSLRMYWGALEFDSVGSVISIALDPGFTTADYAVFAFQGNGFPAVVDSKTLNTIRLKVTNSYSGGSGYFFAIGV